MKRHRIISCFFLCVVFTGLVFTSIAQNTDPANFTNIIPPSPEVSALGKYLNMPISYTTGVPEISIPLYTIQTGDISIPIQLSYHASGIRVEETAGWAGLGWSLSAGGNVSRVVHGLPDDAGPNGYMYTVNTIDTIINSGFNSTYLHSELFQQACVNKTLDVEPDQFIFSAPGYSGSFYYDQRSKQFVQTPFSRVRISYSTTGGANINGFVLTLPDGTNCYFGVSADGTRSAVDQFNSQENVSYSQTSGYSLGTNVGAELTNINSWQLMDIISPTGKAVHYYYDSYTSVEYGRGGESKDFEGTSGCTVTGTSVVTTSYYSQNSSKMLLDSITTDIGTVRFRPSASSRLDVLSGLPSLDTVIICTSKDSILKKFVLYHSYFHSKDSSGISVTVSYPAPRTVLQVSTSRLRLDSVQQFSGTGQSMPSYALSYNASYTLPDKMSTNQDFWGYYNHKSNGQFLTPSVNLSQLGNDLTGTFTGADRTVDTNYAQACMLTQIRYPTGGSTQYYYESNTANSTNTSLLLNGYSYAVLAGKEFFTSNSNADLSSQNTSSATYLDTFYIGPISGAANISVGGCTDFNNLSCPLTISIQGITNPAFSMGLNAASLQASLPEGEYQITAVAEKSGGVAAPFTVQLMWGEFEPGYGPNNTIIGGLRIKKIVGLDPFGNTTLTRTLKYHLLSDPTGSTSSGLLLNVPVHAFLISCGTGLPTDLTEGGTQADEQGSVLRLASNSALPLSSTDGTTIRYTNVQEYQDAAASSMKTELTYFDDLFEWEPATGTNYPFPSNVQRDWRDLLLEKKQYSNTADGGYSLVDDQQNFYTSYQAIGNDSFGIKLGPLPTALAFSYKLYGYSSEWYVLDSSVHTSYPSGVDTSAAMVSSIKYLYDQNNYAVADEQSVDSKGELTEKKTYYPQDYNASAGANISTLIGNNMVEKPIRQEVLKNGKVVKGQVATYYPTGLPQNTYAFQNTAPMNSIALNPAVIVPSSYVLKTTAYWNTTGNLDELNSTTNYPTAYLWDYVNNYPICQVKNADSTSIAYTSFEADGSGNWTIGSPARDHSAITGSQCYSLANGACSRSGLSSGGTYVVSYWSRTGNSYTVTGSQSVTQGKTINGWTYFEHMVTGASSISISGSGDIDELRLYPSNAQMTTYTYSPLTGMTASCDVDNRVTYYTYDGFGRLRYVSDQDGNIVKTYEYHYQGQ